MTASERPAGFTLVEVMVALAVIGIVLVSLFRVQSGSIDLTGSTRFQNNAVLLAKEKLAFIENDMADAESGSGRFDPPFDRFQWTVTVSDIDIQHNEIIPDNDSGLLKKITIDIRQEDDNRSYHVETFRFAPGE